MRISLAPADVEVIVFWTRHPRPLLPYLDELDQRGYHYYFQYTLLDYPRSIDTASPLLQVRLHSFQELAQHIGPERIIWRYDPILFTEITPASFHLETYARLAEELRGFAHHSVISILAVYAKIQHRMAEMARQGARLLHPFDPQESWFGNLMRGMVASAQANSMVIESCASEILLQDYGIQPGKCVDDDYILATFGLDVAHMKDPGQRKQCGCVLSKDIGAYDTCLFGCQYCYATSSFEHARARHARYDPLSPSLIQWDPPA